jgi:hypothetical protein
MDEVREQPGIAVDWARSAVGQPPNARPTCRLHWVLWVLPQRAYNPVGGIRRDSQRKGGRWRLAALDNSEGARVCVDRGVV